ncbi:UTP--glucose-1-phosphate uridylyltransferase GalU [Galactobacter sp.]|uniref:UTP--glucose-1-phosphate uridylyltransferase GalU n=1 Tax=Galactobacter sp. TaxID=2676125 RepID=UPI0025C1C561|nr:UTP--glucose-1-phosphate uridylyltransferase GalU [Galactobacter sp.]
MTNSKVKKAVFPVAGLGTRFLPATKAMPKEMLPVVDIPAIQYVVEEAVRSGLDDLLMVTGRSKRALEDHFDRIPNLEAQLREKGDTTKLNAVQHATNLGDIHYIRQGDPRGLGHAVLRARAHVGDEPFAVLLGDDLIHADDDLLKQMVEVQERVGGSVIALMEVPHSQISSYGCADISEVPGEDYVKVNTLVEKPAPDEAPSDLAVIGRYVLHPAVFDVLEHTEPGRGNEIQLTDALLELATMDPADGGGVTAVVFRGRRFDTGDKLSYIKAVIQLASERKDLGPDLTKWLKEYIPTAPSWD